MYDKCTVNILFDIESLQMFSHFLEVRCKVGLGSG